MGVGRTGRPSLDRSAAGTVRRPVQWERRPVGQAKKDEEVKNTLRQRPPCRDAPRVATRCQNEACRPPAPIPEHRFRLFRYPTPTNPDTLSPPSIRPLRPNPTRSTIRMDQPAPSSPSTKLRDHVAEAGIRPYCHAARALSLRYEVQERARPKRI